MKMILDLDTGIDDTFALMYAIANPDIQLLGVTGSFGNVTRDQGIHNDLALLSMVGHQEIPVFKGECHPLFADHFTVSEGCEIFHGKNGTGDVEIPAKSIGSVQPQSAIDFIIQSVKTYGKDVTLVPTGSLTTMARVIQQAPELISKMHIVMMGGAAIQAGNNDKFAECNIAQDPDAADVVLSSGADITMVGLDVTMQTYTTQAFINKVRALGNTQATFFADMCDFYIKASNPYVPACAQDTFVLHDPLAVGVAFNPQYVRCVEVPLRVDTEEPGRGRIISDPLEVMAKKTPVHVALEVQNETFVSHLEETLYSFFSSFSEKE